MTVPSPRSQYPLWVKLSLFGVPGRRGMWAFVILSFAAAVVCAVYGFRDFRFFFAVGPLLLAGFAYWSTIRWVDRNGSWDA